MDLAYRFELPGLVELLRQYGGQGNCYDTNGNLVGEGNGDLNGEQRSKIIVEDDIDIIKDSCNLAIPGVQVTYKSQKSLTSLLPLRIELMQFTFYLQVSVTTSERN